MMRCVFLLASACVAAPCSAALGELDVPLTIRDVAGVPRTAEPCSTGVPLPKGRSID